MLRLFSNCYCHLVLFAQRTPKATKKSLNEIDPSTIITLVIQFAVIITLVIIAYYVVTKIRDSRHEKKMTLSDHLSDFQNLETEGNMSKEEYNQVRKHLSQEILKDVTMPKDTKNSEE